MSKAFPEERAENNAYIKKCRASTISPQEKAKANAYTKRSRTKETSIEYYVSKFPDMVSEGPLYICSCCDQLWYKHSVLQASKLREKNPHIYKYLIDKTSVHDIEWICITCHRYLTKSKIPPCAVINGMSFPPKPAFFDLNELECRLLAPRIAFQKLMQAPRGKQFKRHGNIVNVSTDVSDTVRMLLRLPNETATVKVNLKRGLQYKSSALSLTVRLSNSSNLYKEEGVVLNQDWLKSYNENLSSHSGNIDKENVTLNANKENNEESPQNRTDCVTGVKMRQKFLQV